MLLKTERLIIRHVVADDWKSIRDIWVDFNSSDYAQYDTPHITEDANVQARIAKWASFNSGTEHMFFAICLDETVIGYVAFNIREIGYEIGYCFHSAYHGKGYAKESMLALFDYLRTMGITKFSAGTALNNTPSVKLLTSLGFKLAAQEKVSFYKDAIGNDIIFDGGKFEMEYTKRCKNGGSEMSRFAVILYPNFSLQEIACLTSALTVWFDEKIDFIATENKEYISEEGLRVIPTKIMADTNITDYDCVILPGTINPLPALYDERLIDFLKSGSNTNVVFAAISSSPLLLAKAGILNGKKFTAGFFMQMAEVYPFIEKENFTHEGIVCDGNVITGIGMFFREFAEVVLNRFDYDVGNNFMRDRPEDYTLEELTFYWSEEDYREFLEELKEYQP